MLPSEILPGLAFYLFAAIACVSGLMVVSARNPVHSVLFLILTFFNAAGLMLLLGAEFVAMLLVIVYVGAVAVLFLFVVMMLDVDFEQLRLGMIQYLPVGALIGIVLLIELIIIFSAWPALTPGTIVAHAPAAGVTNTKALGLILYTDYAYAFQLAGLVLLVAMIGAIVLTHRARPGVRRQVIGSQVGRKPSESMILSKPATGAGVTIPTGKEG